MPLPSESALPFWRAQGCQDAVVRQATRAIRSEEGPPTRRWCNVEED